MSLAQVQFPPPTEHGLDEWFMEHDQHHLALIAAIGRQHGVALQYYPIYPVNGDDLTVWNRGHQAMHNQMNEALTIAGSDISTLDLKSKDKNNWFFQHFIMHQAAAELCGEPV